MNKLYHAFLGFMPGQDEYFATLTLPRRTLSLTVVFGPLELQISNHVDNNLAYEVFIRATCNRGLFDKHSPLGLFIRGEKTIIFLCKDPRSMLFTMQIIQ